MTPKKKACNEEENTPTAKRTTTTAGKGAKSEELKKIAEVVSALYDAASSDAPLPSEDRKRFLEEVVECMKGCADWQRYHHTDRSGEGAMLSTSAGNHHRI
jgi:hypothetical protein